MAYDYLIVGSGFFGSICAYELNKAGYKVCVVEKRNHIGGNCYTSNRDGINVHDYGPHIFHTSNEEVWKWITQFASFNNFTLRPVANYKGEIYSLPFNMWTFSKLWNVTHPDQAKRIIEIQSSDIGDATNLEEQAIKLVGKDIYEKLIKGYTEKQWRKPANELPKEIIKRLPVRFTYDNNYFNDKFQGIPIGGYTQIFEKLLDGIDVRLNTDFFKDELPHYNKLIYTGPIDKFFDYKYGELEYKTTIFEHKKLITDDYQGTVMMNYTDVNIPFTRVIEHKHFEDIKSDITWVTFEYPTDYKANETEPYYPVNDDINNERYLKYKKDTENLENVYFGGRLAEYKYYDMHQVIESALNFIKKQMKIGYVISAYFGNRNVMHDKLNLDNLYYIKLQLEYIKKSIVPISNVYIICTFDSNQNSNSILSQLENLTKEDETISVYSRENLGGSYCSWKFALDIDNGNSDYILLLEDDYVMYDPNSINYLLKYFYNDNDLFYLCQYWNETPYHCGYYNNIIPAHAALSIGMINNKLYNKYKNENGIDFKLTYESGYPAMNANQASFLENYRSNNIKIMDWRDNYSSYYPHSDIDFGIVDGPFIFKPIINKFFN
jgi:UDP-galactopyranose mutase